MIQVADTTQHSREFVVDGFIFNQKSHISCIVDKLWIMFYRIKGI